jgi:Mg2+ and Co2+ transporter CorA
MKLLGIFNILLVLAVIFGFAQNFGFLPIIDHYWIVVDFCVLIISSLSALLFLRRKKIK